MKFIKLKEYLKGKEIIECPNCHEELILENKNISFPIKILPTKSEMPFRKKRRKSIKIPFTKDEKTMIEGMHMNGFTTTQIARRLKRPHTSIHGYIRRNL